MKLIIYITPQQLFTLKGLLLHLKNAISYEKQKGIELHTFILKEDTAVLNHLYDQLLKNETTP